MKARRKRTFLVLMVVLLTLLSTLVKGQTQTVDIRQAIDIALANNYSLRADSLDVLVTNYRNKEVAGRYLPQASLASRTNYNIAIPNQMLPGNVVGQPSKDLVPVQFGTRYEAGTGIEVTQTIYRKDLLIQMQAAGLNTQISQTKYNLSKEQLVYQVAAQFYSLQSLGETIRTTTQDYLNMKDILSIAQQQFENGLLKRIEFESLQINVANKQSQLNQLMVQYNEQLSYFKYLIGVPVDADVAINDTIAIVKSDNDPTGQQLQQRHDLQLSQQLISSKQVDIASIRAERLPVINSYFKYNYQSQFNKTGNFFDNDFKSSSIGISVSVSLFDGYRRKNRIQAAQMQLEQLTWQNKYQQQLAVTQFTTANVTLSNNRTQFEVNKRNLALAEKVFSSRRALYAEGVTTLVELLDAEKELTQARNLYMQSLINVQTGLLDVYKADGTLLTQFLKSI